MYTMPHRHCQTCSANTEFPPPKSTDHLTRVARGTLVIHGRHGLGGGGRPHGPAAYAGLLVSVGAVRRHVLGAGACV